MRIRRKNVLRHILFYVVMKNCIFIILEYLKDTQEI